MIAGSYTLVDTNALNDLELGAGVLVENWSVDDPEITASEVMAVTTGGITVNIMPTIEDFGSDVDNCPENTAELAYISKYDASITTTLLDVGNDSNMAFVIGSATKSGSGNKTIQPTYELTRTGTGTNFKSITWIGDLADGRAVAVKLTRALSTGGLSLKTTKDEKGSTSVTITAFNTISSPTTVPVTVYIFEGGEDEGEEH